MHRLSAGSSEAQQNDVYREQRCSQNDKVPASCFRLDCFGPIACCLRHSIVQFGLCRFQLHCFSQFYCAVPRSDSSNQKHQTMSMKNDVTMTTVPYDYYITT
jgi:hypothetical protein